MSSKVHVILAIYALSLVAHASACGSDGNPCHERQVTRSASSGGTEPTLPPIPLFCQTGRPEAAVDCACLLLVTDRVAIKARDTFMDVCEQFIGLEAILKFGPRGCRRFRIKIKRRLRLFKVLRLFKFVNKLLPVCVPVDVPRLVLLRIKY